MSDLNRRLFCLGVPGSLMFLSTSALASPARLGLIFVAQSSCPYCQALSPILKRLEDEAGIEVLVASMDQRPLAPFVGFEDGTQHPLTSHFRDVPHVMVFSANVGEVTHVVSGLRNMRHFALRLSRALREASAL